MSNPRPQSRGRDASRRGRSVGQSGSPWRWAAVLSVIALIAVAAVWLLTRKGPGEQFDNLGQDHIAAGTPVVYNSDPPTSGPHLGTPSRWGILETAPPDQALVHNLEHGGIVVYYNPTRLPGDQLKQLTDQMLELQRINHRVILVPRPTLNAGVAMTAWTYLETTDSYDSGALRSFFDAHIGDGPECTPNCPP